MRRQSTAAARGERLRLIRLQKIGQQIEIVVLISREGVTSHRQHNFLDVFLIDIIMQGARGIHSDQRRVIGWNIRELQIGGVHSSAFQRFLEYSAWVMNRKTKTFCRL